MMNAKLLLNNCNFSDWGGLETVNKHRLEKQSSHDCDCVPARAQNKGFVVYTKQANVFRSMISKPGDRAQTQSLYVPATRSTGSDLELLPNTQPRPQKWIQSQWPWKSASAFFPVCVNNDTPLLRLVPSLPLLSLRPWQRARETKQACVALQS